MGCVHEDLKQPPKDGNRRFIHEKTISLLLSVLMLLSLLTACGRQPTNKVTEFDEENIVLQFGAVSDIHIGRSGSGIETDKWAIDAYKMLRDLAAQYSADGLSAVLVSGDLTDNAKNKAPVLPVDAISVTDNAAGKAPGEKVAVTLTFKSGTDDDQIHAYAVTTHDAEGKIVETQRVLADFYKVLQPDEMKTEWSFDLSGKYLKGETYEIMLMAADDWGVASNIVRYTYQP